MRTTLIEGGSSLHRSELYEIGYRLPNQLHVKLPRACKFASWGTHFSSELQAAGKMIEKNRTRKIP